MKFKKALKLLKQGECVKTPNNNIVKLDTEANCLTTFDGYYFTNHIYIEDILSDDWRLPSEYELQCLKDDYDTETEIYVPKKEITGIEFVKDIHNKQYIVNFKVGKYPSASILHSYNFLFSQLSKLNSADQLAELLAQVILDYDDCKVSRSLLKRKSEHFWRGNL